MELNQPNNPLHWISLIKILVYLKDKHWREKLWEFIDINCFKNNPTLNSSLIFLRKHEWARKEVEELYLRTKENENN